MNSHDKEEITNKILINELLARTITINFQFVSSGWP